MEHNMKRWTVAVVVMVAMLGLGQLAFADDAATRPSATDVPATQPTPMAENPSAPKQTLAAEKPAEKTAVAPVEQPKPAGDAAAGTPKAKAAAKTPDNKPTAPEQSGKFPTPSELVQRMRQA